MEGNPVVTDDDALSRTEPDWTRRCKALDLNDMPPGAPYMLRTSDDNTSPWRSVKTRHQGFCTDEETDARFYYVTVESTTTTANVYSTTTTRSKWASFGHRGGPTIWNHQSGPQPDSTDA